MEKIQKEVVKEAEALNKLHKLTNLFQPKDIKIIIEKTEFPDSLEADFGGTGNRGKIYFNASNLDEAKQRIDNFIKARKHLTEVANNG